MRWPVDQRKQGQIRIEPGRHYSLDKRYVLARAYCDLKAGDWVYINSYGGCEPHENPAYGEAGSLGYLEWDILESELGWVCTEGFDGYVPFRKAR